MKRAMITGLVLIQGVALGGCGDSANPLHSVASTRDTLANGVIVVHYTALPDSAGQTVSGELTIGAFEGDPALVFGDIRGIEADSDGTIFVLDYQAAEIRTFDSAGGYLRTIATRGDGPGELTEANGMILSGDSLL